MNHKTIQKDEARAGGMKKSFGSAELPFVRATQNFFSMTGPAKQPLHHSENKRVAVHNMGCRANQADGTFLIGSFLEQGYQIVTKNDPADIYILNTCTVTDKADREARYLTRQMKRRNPSAQVIVTGCYAQIEPEAVAALESVDAVITNQDKEAVAELLPVVSKTNNIRQQKEMLTFGKARYSKNNRPHLKVQDGCDKFCSFCIIPFARGASRSASLRQVLDELHDLADAGFQEAVLTGIHLGTYGDDHNEGLESLLQLIEHEKPIPRVRLSSIDPEEITDSMINLVAESDIICPHFHIPLQSGSDLILERMRRHYTADHFIKVVSKIADRIPDVAIGTDVIVGFPGEEEKELEETKAVLRDSPVSYFHVFPYSPRRNTAAAHYPDQIASSIKADRVETLIDLGSTKRKHFHQKFLGTTQEIIVESRRDDREGLLKGITANYIPVYFEGDDMLVNQRVSVKLDHIRNQRTYGELACSAG